MSLLYSFFSAEKEERASTGEGQPNGKCALAYDIACKFSKTVKRSPLRELAEWMKFLPVIGTMHGYAHARRCQLSFLMLYIVGVGLEDGEFCERYFSASNALASVTRYMSSFHRRQAIAEYAYCRDNFESYGKLSTFIYNNYRQALKILSTADAVGQEMREAGITSSEMFYEWLEEEGEYLQSLTRPPAIETLAIEYYQKLEAFNACHTRLKASRLAWLNYKPEAQRDLTNMLEKKARDEQENEGKLMVDIQVLESKMEIKDRWTEGCEEWAAAKKTCRESAYRKALDKLEGLLVSRIFEMAKLNVAGTGEELIIEFLNKL